MSSIVAFAQQLDGYNCIYLNSHKNNQRGFDDRIKASFENKGFKVVTSYLNSFLLDLLFYAFVKGKNKGGAILLISSSLSLVIAYVSYVDYALSQTAP